MIEILNYFGLVKRGRFRIFELILNKALKQRTYKTIRLFFLPIAKTKFQNKTTNERDASLRINDR